MTIAVACNLSDGVILGVDSAVTLAQGTSVTKIYENADKLFQLGDRPIGVATFGIAALAGRTTGSLLREFALRDPSKVVTGNSSVADVAEGLRAFFSANYNATIAAMPGPQREEFEKIPLEGRAMLGLVVAGFSHGEYLSEVWEVQIPQHDKSGAAVQRKAPGVFGSDWFAMCEPIVRYIKGYDRALLDSLANWMIAKRGGAALSTAEIDDLNKIIGAYEYQIPFQAMPIEEGLRYTRFLVEIAINHHRFSLGPSVVGGKAKIGMVTYKGETFRILDS